MPQLLSEAPGKAPHNPPKIHVPFTAYLEISQPHLNKRTSLDHFFKKEADNIELLLDTFCLGSGGTSGTINFDYAKPIAYTYRFGNKTARFTIHGHACALSNFGPTFNQNTVINNGEYKTGPIYNSGNLIPTAELNALCKILKTSLETSTGYPVYKMSLAGIIYGNNGFHFPL